MSELPRVTEILRAYSEYGNVPPDILHRAAARGTSVHALCAGIAKDSWVPDSCIKEDELPYVNSFRVWKEDSVKEFILIEKRLQDTELKYTGQIDMVIEGKDGHKYLVDLKTSSKPQKTYPLQMAAYRNLLHCEGYVVKGVFLVYLQKDGKPPKTQYLEDTTHEFDIFRSALSTWHYFNSAVRTSNNFNTKRVT